jgi:hypothetical protein
MKEELGRTHIQAAVTCFKVASWNLPGSTEENQITPVSRNFFVVIQ